MEPTPLVQDFVKQLGDAEKNDPALFKANLATHAADALTAFELGTEFCRLAGQGAQFETIPCKLADDERGRIEDPLQSKDDPAPPVVASDGTTKADTTDRVSQQTVDAKVRVDSLKLFEISAFSTVLS